MVEGAGESVGRGGFRGGQGAQGRCRRAGDWGKEDPGERKGTRKGGITDSEVEL